MWEPAGGWKFMIKRKKPREREKKLHLENFICNTYSTSLYCVGTQIQAVACTVTEWRLAGTLHNCCVTYFLATPSGMQVMCVCCTQQHLLGSCPTRSALRPQMPVLVTMHAATSIPAMVACYVRAVRPAKIVAPMKLLQTHQIRAQPHSKPHLSSVNPPPT